MARSEIQREQQLRLVSSEYPDGFCGWVLPPQIPKVVGHQGFLVAI